MRPVRQNHLDLFEHDANEQIFGEIPRHPIGIVFIILGAASISILLLIGLYIVVSNQDAFQENINVELNNTSSIIGWAVAFIISVIALGALMSAWVYQANYIILTDQKLVFVSSRSIIARRVSQLSIGDIQDVTIDQLTLFSRIFHYGTINIETAGEQANFSFPYAKDPHNNAKFIVNAHEENLKLYGN